MAHNNPNSPHLSNNLQNGSASASPANMSNAQGSGESRQPVSYQSPTSYPSPSAQYAYPNPNNAQGNDPYRASPTGSNGSIPLPSMRSLEHPLQQQQQHGMGSSLPQPVAPMGGGSPYYHNQGQSLPHPQYPNVTSDPNGALRYAINPTDNRVMSGGRHKKEIKRRTKTGCLTCRKRRIKCDEGQPSCRNCQKSKRECQGYDPIFKQQPGPAAIQPAPSSGPSPGSIAATANPYGVQPHLMQGYPPQGNLNYDPALSAAASSPGSVPPYEYPSAIDPALEAATAAAPIPTTAYSIPAKRDMESLLKVDDLPQLSPIPDPTQNPQQIEEAKHLYYSIYAPGLESFLETKWFTSQGINKLVSNKDTLTQFATLMKRFSATDANDPEQMKVTARHEARAVWQLATMVHAGAADAVHKQTGLVPSTDDAGEATLRLALVEILLTGAVAGGNALTRPVPGSTDHHRLRELEFWFTLGNFVMCPFEDSNATKQIDDTLLALRNLLDGRENRDVLYSIAVVRALSHRVSEYSDNDTPLHFDENDNKSKLSIAKKFVFDEGEGAGTTNVIRRLCNLATRSWASASPDTSARPAAPQPAPAEPVVEEKKEPES